VSTHGFAPGEAASANELAKAGLLLAGEGTHVSPYAVFIPADERGAARPVEIGPGCRVGAYAVICGGTVLRENARVEEHALVGTPERGYAVGHVYEATVPVARASRHAVIRRATSGVTLPATWPGRTNAKPASSPLAQ
jgi:tetrahydrodipicolinate N-succinyltransferase